jgi:hypothetical protein
MIKRLNLRRQDEFKELASVEFRRLMYFLDTIIALKGDLKCFGVEIHKTKDEKFNPMEFNLQFRLEPLRTGLRLAYKEDTETKTYQFYNFINTVAELKIKKSQPEQVTYTRKIGFKNRQWVPYWIDCSRGTRIVYSGDLYGNGQVALIKA